ncbi:hypothetical protein C8J98_102271 [Luteibacter sp. OK325]|nr:hypothetical protein C8J98_102271 [Luteibacter sp. OK325]
MSLVGAGHIWLENVRCIANHECPAPALRKAHSLTTRRVARQRHRYQTAFGAL